MTVYDIILVAGAIIPGIILLVYIYIKDKAEKEPASLLIKLLFFGALSVIPTIGGEILFDLVLGLFFKYESQGVLIYIKDWTIYQVLYNFIRIALVEEGCKWLFLYFTTRKNRNFNSLFDGIIYSVFVSLGFAIAENIKYAFTYRDISVVILRAFTSIPGHMFFAIFMGYFYTMWNVARTAGIYEKILFNNQPVRKPFSSSNFLALSIVVPVLIHGFYDFCLNFGSLERVVNYESVIDEIANVAVTISKILYIVFYVALAIMYIYCFRKVRKISKLDINTSVLAYNLLFNKYPMVYQKLKEEVVDLDKSVLSHEYMTEFMKNICDEYME